MNGQNINEETYQTTTNKAEIFQKGSNDIFPAEGTMIFIKIYYVNLNTFLSNCSKNNFCTTPHLTCTTPHLTCTTPHLTCTTPHLTCTTPHLTCTTPHLTCTTPHLTCITLPYLCRNPLHSKIWACTNSFKLKITKSWKMPWQMHMRVTRNEKLVKHQSFHHTYVTMLYNK